MSIAAIVVVFTIAWWLVFFLLLPVGVVTPEEADEPVEKGNAESAPVNPRIGLKAFWATVFAAILTLVSYWAITSGIVSLAPSS